jgi:predicted transcriptional regulator
VTGNKIRLLAWLVDRYDATEQPVTPREAADRFDSDIETASDTFDSLESDCLLAAVEGGYRPTITARELLELDIDDDTFLIVDTDPDGEELADK